MGRDMMLCGICGKEIPELGRVCPYCHADKGYDQSVLSIAYFLMMSGGLWGWWVGGGQSRESLIGLSVGSVLSVIVMVSNIVYRKAHPIQARPIDL